MTIAEFQKMLRRAVDDAGSVRKYAKSLDCSPQHISDVLLGRREPGPTLLGAFRLRKMVRVTRHVTIERIAK